MQIVHFLKSDYPTGKIKNAERYGISVDNGKLLGVSLIGSLYELDEETWEAKRSEVSCLCDATGDNAMELFTQAADEIGYESLNETYIRMLVDDE